jgi:hypothetical protein
MNNIRQIRYQILIKVRPPDDEQFPLRHVYVRSPHACVNQMLQIQLELLMMSGSHSDLTMAGHQIRM